jgi:hypothetical protein
MTKSDYISTAKILRDFCPQLNQDEEYRMSRYAFPNLVKKFATMFADDNPNFDADKFYKACEL